MENLRCKDTEHEMDTWITCVLVGFYLGVTGT